MATDPITDITSADSYGAAMMDKVLPSFTKRHWWHIREISADITLADTDEFISADASGSGGDVTISLPDADTVAGQSVIIYCSAVVSGQSVVVQPLSSGETVGGSASQSITTADEFIHIISDGADNWILYIDGR